MRGFELTNGYLKHDLFFDSFGRSQAETGKNATDSAMVIGGMDLLYSSRFESFYLVSINSEFTRLAARIRKLSLIVYRFGERKTPEPFVSARGEFIYVVILAAKPDGAPSLEPRLPSPLKKDVGPITLPRHVIRTASAAEGWATFGSMGLMITKQCSFGYGKLSDLIAATDLFELARRNQANVVPCHPCPKKESGDT